MGAQFIAPVIKGRQAAKLIGATYFFFLGYRCYHDGGHHFLHQHPWEQPKHLEYLDKVDKKYGTRYGLDNMHH
jgi:hypothetical protein